MNLVTSLFEQLVPQKKGLIHQYETYLDLANFHSFESIEVMHLKAENNYGFNENYVDDETGVLLIG